MIKVDRRSKYTLPAFYRQVRGVSQRALLRLNYKVNRVRRCV